MSTPTTAPQACRLTVNASDEATYLRIFDAEFQLVAHGTGRVAEDLAPGLYQVKARLGNGEFSEIVALDSGPRDVAVPPLAFSSPAPLEMTAKTHEDHIANAASQSTADHLHLGSGSWLYFFSRAWSVPQPVESMAASPAGDLMRGLRLLDAHEQVLVELSSAAISGPEQFDPWSACNIAVDPGAYVLELLLGDDPDAGVAAGSWSQVRTLRQTLIASPGWQTQYFCLPRTYDGVGRRADLSQATMLMSNGPGFRPDDKMDRLSEQARLCLLSSRASLSREEMKRILDGEYANPLLGMFGAHLALLQRERRLGSRRSQSENLPADDGVDLTRVVNRLRSLLGGPHLDVEALALAAGMESTVAAFWQPPMLRRSWSIVCEETAKSPQCVPEGSLADRASDEITGDGIWLTWMNRAPLPDGETRSQLARDIRANVAFHRRAKRSAAAEAPAASELDAPIERALEVAGQTTPAHLLDESDVERLVFGFGLPRPKIEALMRSSAELPEIDLEGPQWLASAMAEGQVGCHVGPPPAVRSRRLRRLFKRVGRELGVRSRTFESPDPVLTPGVDPSVLARVRAAQPTTPAELSLLEAAVLPAMRPIVRVRDGRYEPLPPGAWDRLNRPEVRHRLEPLCASVGRIELAASEQPILPFAGSAFVVAPRLLLTSASAARLFSAGSGTGAACRPGAARVNFRAEDEADPPADARAEVVGVRLVIPELEVALIEVDRLPAWTAPLPLSTADPATLVRADVVVIGHPGHDYHNDGAVQDRVFKHMYGVKRLAPGKVRPRRPAAAGSRRVNALTYDSATIGVDTGAAVVHLDSGAVVALHIASEYLARNYGVAMFEVARHPRFVAALCAPAAAARPAEARPSRPAPTAESPTAGGATPMSSAGGALQFAVPLSVSISIGSPTAEPRATGAGPAFVPAVRVAERPTQAVAGEQVVARFSLPALSSPGFAWSAALSTVLASRLAYSGAAAAATTVRSLWRFDDCQFLDVDDAQCFVAVAASVVLVSFRGSDSRGDWVANLNALWTTRPYGKVHRGFYGQFLALQPSLEAALRGAANRPVIVTGHSLGAAVATVAAAEWHGRFPVSGVYTFGQPAVGRGTFAAVMTANYGRKFYRFVNDNDIVPRVPPGYSHVGRLLKFDSAGRVSGITAGAETTASPSSPVEPPMLTEAEFDALRGALLMQRAQRELSLAAESAPPAEVEGLFGGFANHAIERYVALVAAAAGGG
jgi:hypothetical protein